MPSEEEMMQDLKEADASGDTELAQHIASLIKQQRMSTKTTPKAPQQEEKKSFLQELGGDLRSSFGSLEATKKTMSEGLAGSLVESPVIKGGIEKLILNSLIDKETSQKLQQKIQERGYAADIYGQIKPKEIVAKEAAQKIEEAKNKKSLSESLHSLAGFAREHPGSVTAEVVKGFIQDPEMLIPLLGESGASVKAGEIITKLTEKFGSLENAAKAAGKIAAAGTKVAGGVATNASFEAAKELAQGKNLDINQIAAQGVVGGVLSLASIGKSGFDSQLKNWIKTAKPELDASTIDRIVQEHIGDLSKEKVQEKLKPLTTGTKVSKTGKPIPQAPAQMREQKEALARVEEHLEKTKDSREQTLKESHEAILREQERLETLAPKQPAPRGYARFQKGEADPKLLAEIGLIGGGAALGYTMSDPSKKLEGALLGGAIGGIALAAPAAASKIISNWKEAVPPVITSTALVAGGTAIDKNDRTEGALLGLAAAGFRLLPKASISTTEKLVMLRDGDIAASERKAWQISSAIKMLVPEADRRSAVSVAVEQDNIKSLSPQEQTAAKLWKKISGEYADRGIESGVLKGFIDNYVTHIVEQTGTPKSKVQEILGSLGIGQEGTAGIGGTSTKSRFGKERKYGSFEELNAALEGTGLQIKTMDLADIAHTYIRSMDTAMANQRLINSLKEMKDTPESKIPMLYHGDKRILGYQTINHPQMFGYQVHPDLVDPLKFVFDARDRNSAVQGFRAVSNTIKRLNTSASLFHAQSLVSAAISAGYTGGKRGIDAALHEFKNGVSKDDTDILLRAGVSVGVPHDIDLHALRDAGAFVDQIFNRATGIKQSVGEKLFGGYESKVQQTLDKATWEYLHTGLKLAVAHQKLNEYRLRNEKLPLDKRLPDAEIASGVASFVNDSFGGQNWFKAVAESRTQIGKKLSYMTLSPSGRDLMQIFMFAPDWTLSTIRAATKALPGSTSNPVNAREARMYAARTAIIYATVMNAMNIAASGKPIWENEDPTRIQFKDKTSIQVNKHAMELAELVRHPGQTMASKLGYLPKEFLAQVEGKEYFSAHPNSVPDIGDRFAHMVKGMLPFPMSEIFAPGRTAVDKLKHMASSAVGAPQYGSTAREKELARQERARVNRKRRRGENR